jgi:hypothetical protein
MTQSTKQLKKQPRWPIKAWLDFKRFQDNFIFKYWDNNILDWSRSTHQLATQFIGLGGFNKLVF